MLAESWFHEALVVQLEFRDMRFKNKLETNPDTKYCLTAEIEVSEVEKVVKFADFPM